MLRYVPPVPRVLRGTRAHSRGTTPRPAPRLLRAAARPASRLGASCHVRRNRRPRRCRRGGERPAVLDSPRRHGRARATVRDRGREELGPSRKRGSPACASAGAWSALYPSPSRRGRPRTSWSRSSRREPVPRPSRVVRIPASRSRPRRGAPSGEQELTQEHGHGSIPRAGQTRRRRSTTPAPDVRTISSPSRRAGPRNAGRSAGTKTGASTGVATGRKNLRLFPDRCLCRLRRRLGARGLERSEERLRIGDELIARCLRGRPRPRFAPDARSRSALGGGPRDASGSGPGMRLR